MSDFAGLDPTKGAATFSNGLICLSRLHVFFQATFCLHRRPWIVGAVAEQVGYSGLMNSSRSG